MLFNSIEFLFIFLPITFFIYFGLNKLKLIKIATAWLVIASLAFYSYWKIDYLPLILISMLFNYSVGSTLTSEKKLKEIIYSETDNNVIPNLFQNLTNCKTLKQVQNDNFSPYNLKLYIKNNLRINRKLVMVLAIAVNIGLLCYYKYFNFIIENINAVFSANFNFMNIMLPLAISFFTFQQIAYIVDSYEYKTKEYDFLTYSLFVTFFPQLIAGPIVHHKEMMPQFANLRNRFINHKNISIGLFLLAIGLFKKIIIADTFSSFVHGMFDEVNTLTFLEAWCASISYTMQLYFDFSGYCDMAMGIGYLFNIILPQNFNSPYKADSIQDFWRRWHMTLSRFLRDYIYIPLGGNRKGELKTYRNLFLTFLIGGIWHGANWTFIIWGIMHGLATCIHKFWKNLNIKIPHFIAVIITFLFINITWVYFRAASITKANNIILSMFGFNGFEPIIINKLRFSFENGSFKLSILLLIASFILTFCVKNSIELSKKLKPNILCLTVTLMLLIVSILSINKVSEFLYFQF